MSFDKAIEYAEKAIDADGLENDKEAIKNYVYAVEYLNIAKTEPENKDDMDMIISKIEEYNDRIKYLKDLNPGVYDSFIEQIKNEVSSQIKSSSSSSTTSTQSVKPINDDNLKNQIEKQLQQQMDFTHEVVDDFDDDENPAFANFNPNAAIAAQQQQQQQQNEVQFPAFNPNAVQQQNQFPTFGQPQQQQQQQFNGQIQFPSFGQQIDLTNTTGCVNTAVPITGMPQVNTVQTQQKKQKKRKESTPASRSAAIRNKLSIPHPSTLDGTKAWSYATNVAKKGMTFDKNGKRVDAFAYYECAMDLYAHCIRSEDLTDNMKKEIKVELGKYLKRAETLKPEATKYLKSHPDYFGENEDDTDEYLDTCIVCSKSIGDQYINALGYNYHVNCFCDNVVCKFCGKPFDRLNVQFKIYNDQPYHPICFEGVTGLEKEHTNTFTFSKGQIYVKVKLPKKIFKVNESFMYDVTIDNNSEIAVETINTYLLMEETKYQRTIKGDMKGTPVKTKVAKSITEIPGGLKNGVVTKSLLFSLGMVRPSHTNDIMYYRGYKLVVDLVIKSKLGSTKKIIFPIYVNEE